MSPQIPKNKQLSPSVTVGDLQKTLNGHKLSPDITSKTSNMKCDYCSSKIFTNDKVSQYLCDDVLNTKHPKAKYIKESNQFVQLATYCSSCTSELLFYPCRNYSEIRTVFKLSDSWDMINLTVTDVSLNSDGIPWKPKQLSEKISTISFEKSELITNDNLWGPENIYTIYNAALKNIAVEDIINYDGSINNKKLSTAKKEYENFRNIMGSKGFTENAFRDYVKNK